MISIRRLARQMERLNMDDKDTKTMRDELRRQWYHAQVIKGVFVPSSKSEPENDAQERCPHAYADLAWGGNGTTK